MTSHISILYKKNMLAKNEPESMHFHGNDTVVDNLMKFIYDHYLLEVDIYCQHTKMIFVKNFETEKEKPLALLVF